MKIIYYILIFLLFFTSCQSKTIKKQNLPLKQETQKEEFIEMDEAIVKKERIVSISELFREANDLVTAGNYQEALTKYHDLERMVSPKDQTLLQYNIAVTYFKMNQLKKALALYLEILPNIQKDADFLLDVLINITEIYGKQKNWQAIHALLAKHHAQFTFTEHKWDYIELSIRYGVSLYNLKQIDDADFTLSKALRHFKDNKRIFSYLSREQRYFLSMANFFLGEINRTAFETLEVKGKVKEIATILDIKSERLLKAQHYYMQGMNFKDKYWATASGYRIGEMYSIFYDQVIHADIKVKLTFEEKVVYQEELKIRIQNLLKKSIAIFEENIAMSERISEDNLWIKKTLKRLEDAKKKYLQIKKIEIENAS